MTDDAPRTRRSGPSVPRSGPAVSHPATTIDASPAAAPESKRRSARMPRRRAVGPIPAPALEILPPRTEPPRPALTRLWDAAGAVNVKLIYAAYLVSLEVPGAALVGVALATLGRRRTPSGWLASHYAYLVRTFWIGLAAKAVAFALSFFGIGLVLYPLIAVWLVARTVHGLTRAARGEGIDRPDAFVV